MKTFTKSQLINYQLYELFKLGMRIGNQYPPLFKKGYYDEEGLKVIQREWKNLRRREKKTFKKYGLMK